MRSLLVSISLLGFALLGENEGYSPAALIPLGDSTACGNVTGQRGTTVDRLLGGKRLASGHRNLVEPEPEGLLQGIAEPCPSCAFCSTVCLLPPE